jgi:hypothetical protein
MPGMSHHASKEQRSVICGVLPEHYQFLKS